MRGLSQGTALALACLVVGTSRLAHSDERGLAESPPWTVPGDLPLPFDARSVRIKLPKEPASPQMGPAIVAEPGLLSKRRGTAAFEATLPLFGAKRGAECLGRWLLVGPLAWVCSDAVEFSSALSLPPDTPSMFSYRYFFAGADGATAFESPQAAEEGAPLKEYEHGFGIAGIEERRLGRNVYVKTAAGLFIDRAALVPSRISEFHGEDLRKDTHVSLTNGITGPAHLTIAWAKKGTRAFDDAKIAFNRREPLTVTSRDSLKKIDVLRATRKDGTAVVVREKDVVWPTLEAPPAELKKGERWIAIDRSTQTLVAYEFETPVFATLVSTGRGAEGTETSTPKGSFRIWVKLATSNMDNLEDENLSEHYSLEDVPFVQFFSKGVALHGAFWHDDFGVARSHGCVNLTLADAEWLFKFTGPHLPNGWSAALPSELERGTLIVVK